MNAYKDYIISPIGDRYNNSVQVGNKKLVLNTKIMKPGKNYKFPGDYVVETRIKK